MQVIRNVCFLAVVCAPAVAIADGLLYQLPKDGSKVTFEFQAVNKDRGRERKFTGILSIASVGREKVDGADCRWIEILMTINHDGRERRIIAKVLIPETALAEGKMPAANIKRGWLQMGGKSETRGLADAYGPNGGPLPAFLAGPLSDVKKSKPAEVATPIGKLKCVTLTGKATYEQVNGSKRTDRFEVDYSVLRNDKAPFGVAGCTMTIKEYVNKTRLDDVITFTFKLKSVAKNAKSALPDNK